MAKKKGRDAEAKVNTPVQDLDQKETLMHYNAVLMEEQKSMLKLVLERMDVLTDRFDGLTDRVDGLTDRVDGLTDRVDGLTDRVDRGFKETNERFERVESRLSTMELAFRGLKDDMIDMERRICSKINRVAERGDNHECRLSALEASQ